MCFLIKTLNNKKKKKIIVELHKHPMGFKIHDLTLQLGGRKCHLCQSLIPTKTSQKLRMAHALANTQRV